MTPTLDALVRQLREAMAQATPGPWHDSGIADPNGPRPTTWIYGPRAAKDHQSGPCVAHSVPLRDAAYIALCSPANMATLLDALEEAQTAVALKGPEPPLTRWSTHDVPEVAATVVAQRDAAREALVKCTADRDELAAMYLHARLASRQIDLPVDAQRVLDEHRHELYQRLRKHASVLFEMPASEQMIGARDAVLMEALTEIANWMEAHEQWTKR